MLYPVPIDRTLFDITPHCACDYNCTKTPAAELCKVSFAVHNLCILQFAKHQHCSYKQRIGYSTIACCCPIRKELFTRYQI